MKGAISIRCPKCKAKAHEPCVYVLHKKYSEDSDRSPEELARVGKPMLRLHNERHHEAWLVQRRTMGAAQQLDPFGHERAAYAAEVQREYVALRSWLRRYGSVLVRANRL